MNLNLNSKNLQKVADALMKFFYTFYAFLRFCYALQFYRRYAFAEQTRFAGNKYKINSLQILIWR